jgi:hypothetical protein
VVNRSHVIGGFLSGLLLASCVGAVFKYYGMKDVVFDHGKLQGPTEAEDLPFSKCAPNAETNFPCVVMFSKEFFALKQDYEDTKQKLKDCQKP